MSDEWNRKVDELRKARLDQMKDELFIRALEYARLKMFDATLKDGCWHLLCGNDGQDAAKYKLEELGRYACGIAREMTVATNEAAALSDADRAALKAEVGKDEPK